MATEHRFLAVDLGAESGRGEIVTLRDGKVHMEEVHRFANRPVRLGSTLHWDLPSLHAEILATLRHCSHKGVRLDSMSLDTWGVDFGLLGEDDVLLGNPVHYRDARTDGIHAHAAKIMPIEKIFDETALQTMTINTLFQLHAMQRANSPLLKIAKTLLMIPDLLNFYLTGVKACELSEAQTSQLVGLDCQWSPAILDAFQLPKAIFPKLVKPATRLGELSPAVAESVGLPGLPVIATASHDTGAAVAAVPGEGSDWAFLSCGTWSILGMLVDKPVHSRRCHELGFTNEITYGGWYLGRNILGLWLVQELRRKWNTPSSPLDYTKMTQEAADAKSGPLVNVDDASLLAPADMQAALTNLLKNSGQATPENRGQLTRCVLESLALQYAWGMDRIHDLTGVKPKSLYMVGGGIANKLLCQFTANACGVPVHAAADQCTALGNALGQAMALGILRNREEIRQVMRNSFAATVYEPKEAAVWADKRALYAKLHGD